VSITNAKNQKLKQRISSQKVGYLINNHSIKDRLLLLHINLKL